MSTLSAQCAELRELAAKYDELKSGATRVVRISLDTGPVLREAADTICELRDRVQALDGENAKLRELMARMAEALGIDCEWADPNWCKSPCRLEFGCWPEDMAIRCPAWEAMRELGVEP